MKWPGERLRTLLADLESDTGRVREYNVGNRRLEKERALQVAVSTTSGYECLAEVATQDG
jgi:hypothetical protein